MLARLLRASARRKGAVLRRRVESIMASLLGQVCTGPLVGGFGGDASTLLETNVSCNVLPMVRERRVFMSNLAQVLAKSSASAVRHPWLQPYNATAEGSSRALAPAEKTRGLATCKTLANRTRGGAAQCSA